MKKLNLLSLLFAGIIAFSGCNKVDEDESLIFNLHRYSGWFGLDENLKINATVTHYSVNYKEFVIWEPKSYSTTLQTPKEQWDYLVKTFDLKTFKKIKDGQCRTCVDGFDVTFTVIIKGITYSFYNGEDEYYKQMQHFFDAILEQANILYENHKQNL